MRIAIIGAGALGCAIAAELANAGREVILVARGARLTRLQDCPIEIESAGVVRKIPVPVAESLEAADEVDLAIICVKMPDLSAALEILSSRLLPDGVVLTVQNGVEAHEIAATAMPAAAIVASRIHGFFEIDGERVRHVGVAPSLLFGCTQGERNAAEGLVSAAFAGCGLQADAAPDITHALWDKFMLAASVGSVSTALGISAGRICDQPGSSELLRQAMQEIAGIARRAGVMLTDADVSAKMDFVRSFPPDATTSLQRDIEAGRPSEHDALTRAVSRLASRHGVVAEIFPRLEAMIRARLNQNSPSEA